MDRMKQIIDKETSMKARGFAKVLLDEVVSDWLCDEVLDTAVLGRNGVLKRLHRIMRNLVEFEQPELKNSGK